MVRDVSKTASNGAAPLLTIQRATGTPTNVFEIFGRRYDVVDLNGMGLNDRGAMQGLYDRLRGLEALGVAGTATDADEREYDERARAMVRRILPTLPEQVLAELSTGQCAETTAAFFIWRATKSGMMALLAPLTSEKSSLGSRASTAAANGSSQRRSRSSGRSPR